VLLFNLLLIRETQARGEREGWEKARSGAHVAASVGRPCGSIRFDKQFPPLFSEMYHMLHRRVRKEHEVSGKYSWCSQHGGSFVSYGAACSRPVHSTLSCRAITTSKGLPGDLETTWFLKFDWDTLRSSDRNVMRCDVASFRRLNKESQTFGKVSEIYSLIDHAVCIA
jgi:hypothetical protein